MKKFSFVFLIISFCLAMVISCSQEVADFADEMEEEENEIELAEADEDDDDEEEEEGIEEVIEVAENTESKAEEIEKPTTLGGAVKNLASAVLAPVTNLLSFIW